MKNLTIYEKYIINQIEIGDLHKHLGGIVSYPLKRLVYSKAIARLKEMGIVFEMSGEVAVNSSNTIYRSISYRND